MLTRDGWLVIAGSVALVAAGRVFGLPELYALGAMAAALVLASVIRVATTRLDLVVGRRVTPARLAVGTPGRVELSLRNGRETRTGVLRLHDPVSGTAGATMLVDPLDPSGAGDASYRLPTQRRGLLRIGPLRVDVVDPFGLATASTPAAPAVEVTVYPHVDDVPPPPRGVGRDALSSVQRPNAMRYSGEDFYALRPYEVGDDLRRVHWRSSARHDELLVRQADEPWQARTTVVLDVRAAAHGPESFELAVSAAASVLSAAARRDDLIRLVTTDGSDSGFGPGTAQLDRLMEHLALVGTTPDARLATAMARLAARPAAGSLVSVVGDVPGADMDALVRMRRREPAAMVVRVTGPPGAGSSGLGTSGAGTGAGPSGTGSSGTGAGVVTCSAQRPFAVAWTEAVAHRVRVRR